MKTVLTIKTIIALFIVLFVDASLQAATIRYASPTGDDSNNGLSPAEAKTFYGVMSGVQSGDEIRYLKGTYTVDVAQSSLPSTGAIILTGPMTFRGWDGENDRPAEPGEVTIDFGNTGPGYYSVRGINFYDMTIINGKGETYGGGGICLNSNSSYYNEIPVVSNCIFRGCSTAINKAGGALYVARPATVIDCLFESNDNISQGAALYASEGAESSGVHSLTIKRRAKAAPYNLRVRISPIALSPITCRAITGAPSTERLRSPRTASSSRTVLRTAAVP